VPFDLGFARSASKQWLVVEGAGGGLIPAGIARAEAESKHWDDIPPAAEVAAAVRLFRDTLVDLEPQPWTLVVDHQEMSDAFLLVEVLNIRSIGPNLVFAPDASPSDGYFDIITAQQEHRAELLAYLADRAEGRDTRLALPHRQGREVRIAGCQALHIDDERVDTRELGPISLRIEPGAIHVLA
jgi:diacylglycerol kinase family enzyme